MKHIVFVSWLLAVVMLILTGSVVYGFSATDPGVIIDNDIITDPLGQPTSQIVGAKYIGENAAGNHVALLYCENAGNVLIAATYEITNAGTNLGLIDSGTMQLNAGMVGTLNIEHAINDWYLLMSRAGAYSFQCTTEGGLDLNGDFKNSAYYDSCRMFDNIVLGMAISTVFHTLEIDPSDGDINQIDSWEPAGLATEHDLLSMHYNNTSTQWFLFPSAQSEKMYTGRVAANGNITGSWSGSRAWSYADGASEYRDTTYAGDGYYVTGGRLDGGGVGVEVFYMPTPDNITSTGSGVVDAASAQGVGTVKLRDGHILQFWKNAADGSDIYVRMLWSIYSDGFNQSRISTDLEVANYNLPSMEQSGNSVCYLEGTNIVLFAVTDATGSVPHLITFKAAIPPVVRTTGAVPVFTTFNSLIDGAFYATGAVTDIGDSDVTEWGFLYNTTGFPVYGGSRSPTTGTETSAFTFDDTVMDLDTSKKYYLIGYACNSSGTGYGNQRSLMVFPEYQNTPLLLHFEPLQISSGTISDQSGYNHDVSFTLLANPGSLTIDLGAIDTYDWSYTPGTSGRFLLFQDEPIDSGTFNTPQDRTFTGFPGMAMINTQLDNSNIPQAAFWLPFIAAVIVCMGFSAFYITGMQNILTMVIVCGIGVSIGVGFQWFPWWYLPIYIIPAYAFTVGYNSHGGTHL